MDEQLRRAVRGATDDPLALAKAATALERAGDVLGAARLVRAACDRAGASVDVLTPPSIDALRLSIEPHRARGHLDAVAWWPDERGLWARYAVDGTFEVVAWPLGGEGRCLLRPQTIPQPAPSRGRRSDAASLQRLHQVTGLAAVADGRIVLSGVSVAASDAAWYVFDPVSERFTHGPSSAPSTIRGMKPRVVAGWADVVVGDAGGAVFVWNLATAEPPAPWLRAPDFAIGEGTFVTRRRRELLFHRLGEDEAFARQLYPVGLPKGWTGLVAASSGRCVVCDQQGRELILVDSAAGVLGRAPIPVVTTPETWRQAGAPAKIVAVRPCPSGRVVAVRFERSPQLALVDLRTGAGRLIELEHPPRDLTWSPSGRALALPSRRGVLQLLMAGVS